MITVTVTLAASPSEVRAVMDLVNGGTERVYIECSAGRVEIISTAILALAAREAIDRERAR